MKLRSEHHSEDQIPVVALRILVDGGVVGAVGAVVQAHRLEVSGSGGRHVDRRHGREELLRLRLLNAAVLSAPSATLDEETPDVLALVRDVFDALHVIWKHFSVRDHIIQSPLLLLVLACHLLTHACQEALGVREAREPVGSHDASPILQPVVQHLLTFGQASEPASEVGHKPGDFSARRVVGPSSWHTRVKEESKIFHELGRHHHSSVDGGGHVREVRAHDGDDVLKSLQLLEQEDVQRSRKALVRCLWRALQLLDLRSEDLLHEVRRHLGEVVRAHVLHDFIGRLASGAAGILWLRLDDGCDHLRRFLHAVGQVRIRVQAEDIR
mmetsp:Transcript_61073/g.142897  ORF Transcript_61073/g.142897 Transcript_61073/m.142897 type:complete len:326 (-) Transcript_61073:352-1329(-)